MDTAVHIRRTLDGDTRAYAEVVRTYQHMVYTICHRVLRNTEDAEEATQDSFVKAYQHLRSWNGNSKFSTWLYSIAYRTAISHGRRRRSDTSSVDALTHHPTATENSGNDRSELCRHLDQALAQLPSEDSAVLSFFYQEEMSVDEIVTVTGLGASNVKVKLHRGRKKLLDALERTLGPETKALLFDHA